MKTCLRILWLISGILLIACGVYVLLHPAQTLMSIASLLGLAALFSCLLYTSCDRLLLYEKKRGLYDARKGKEK